MVLVSTTYLSNSLFVPVSFLFNFVVRTGFEPVLSPLYSVHRELRYHSPPDYFKTPLSIQLTGVMAVLIAELGINCLAPLRDGFYRP